MTRLPLAAVAALAALLAAASAAAGATERPRQAAPPVGYDLSYPQCDGPFPTDAAFAIVGVNAGLPFGPNPCLGTGDGPSELAWAGMNASFYANTANPGPDHSSHWPVGQTSPQECDTAVNPRPDTPECAYDYGWNAAADSYQDAVLAYVSLGWTPVGSTRTPVANAWWLDVETANSWQSDISLNVAALQGAVAYLSSVGAAGIGFYSTPAQWRQITGGTTVFSAYPSWVAGASSLVEAQAACAGPGFTGGSVALAQYPSGGFDADYLCAVQPALSFAGGSQTLTAGSPSAPLLVQLPQPAGAPVQVNLSSSSPTGRFATSAAGPWSATLELAIPSGAAASVALYYADTKAGSPTLTARATAYADASQSETVRAAALATIRVSPGRARLREGASRSFRASGGDRFGNPVPVPPRWSVSPALGRFSPTTGSRVVFWATRVGRGRVTARLGSVAGVATVVVTRSASA